MTASVQIRGFLQANPSGTLCVLVGYASTAGLAWLAEHTKGRAVDLLVGDTRAKHFNKATDQDRETALDFLDRHDVTVKNWYRTAKSRSGKADMHAKAWLVEPSGRSAGAVLLGSANLTKAGLFQNVEMVALAADREIERLRSEAQRAFSDAWDCKQRLQGAIASRGTAGSASHGQRHRSRRRAPASQAAGQGCAARLALLSAGLAALAAASTRIAVMTLRRLRR